MLLLFERYLGDVEKRKELACACGLRATFSFIDAAIFTHKQAPLDACFRGWL